MTLLGFKRYEEGVKTAEVDGPRLLALGYDELLSLGFADVHAEALLKNIARMQRLVALDDALPVKKALCKFHQMGVCVDKLASITLVVFADTPIKVFS